MAKVGRAKQEEVERWVRELEEGLVLQEGLLEHLHAWKDLSPPERHAGLQVLQACQLLATLPPPPPPDPAPRAWLVVLRLIAAPQQQPAPEPAPEHEDCSVAFRMSYVPPGMFAMLVAWGVGR
eukprot:562629-Rhodomonas_salina.1